MLRRSKQLASLILVAGLGLGVVGCGNKKVDETNKDNLTTMSKNDVEETEKIENNNETLKEEVTDTTDSSIESNISTNTSSVNSNLSNSSSSSSKPSNTTKPSTNSSSSNKPSANKKPSSSSSSSNKPSNTTKPSNSSSSSSKPSATKPSNSSSSSSKPSNTTKPSTNSSSSTKPSNTTKPSNNSGSSSKPSTTTKPSNSSGSSSKPSTTTKPSNSSSSSSTRTWQYMSSLSKETFNALNNFRKANGVAPLKYSSSEQSRANKQAESNVKNNINIHDVDQISYKGNADNTANGFIQAWANSSGHKRNMLDSEYTEGAVSVYKDSKGYYYVVASFHLDW